MYIKVCDNVRIKWKVLDLHDVIIVDSKKVVLFEYESLFYLKLETRRGVI